MITPLKKAHLDRIWTDPDNPNSTCSIRALHNAVRKEGITLSEVREYLSQKRSYTLHRVARKRFLRRRVIVSSPRHTIACDLAEVGHLSRSNNGVRYLLVCLDIYSRYLHVVPLKNKRGLSVAEALADVLEQEESNGYNKMWTDRGREFLNHHVSNLLKSKKIKLYHTESHEIKSSPVERVIRTLKGRIYRYLTEHGTESYIDVLPKIVKGYNYYPHSGIGNVRPVEAHRHRTPTQTRQHMNHALCKSYKNRVRENAPLSLSVGDSVRVSRANEVFKRGFLYQTTEEIFIVDRIDKTQNVTGYYLRDLDGEPIKGIFYREELVKTSMPDKFAIDIIKKRRRNKRVEVLVHYRGYNNTHDRWLPLSEIESSAHV